MKIDVTKADIDNGRPCNLHFCPVVLAIERTLPGYDVHVDYGEILLAAPGQLNCSDWASVPTPAEVSKFIASFDRTAEGSPFSFDLNYEAPKAQGAQV